MTAGIFIPGCGACAVVTAGDINSGKFRMAGLQTGIDHTDQATVAGGCTAINLTITICIPHIACLYCIDAVGHGFAHGVALGILFDRNDTGILAQAGQCGGGDGDRKGVEFIKSIVELGAHLVERRFGRRSVARFEFHPHAADVITGLGNSPYQTKSTAQCPG